MMPKSVTAHHAGIAVLMPELARSFDGWTPGEMRYRIADLDRTELSLDADRDWRAVRCQSF